MRKNIITRIKTPILQYMNRPKEPSCDIREMKQYAMFHYSKKTPAFPTISHEKLEPLDDIPVPRFQKGDDGIYHNDHKNEKHAKLALVGDMMCQMSQQVDLFKKHGAYVFNEQFTFVKEIFALHDFTVGNFELITCSSFPYTSEVDSIHDKPNCNAPSTFLDAVRYGGIDFLACSNNHNCDAGVPGILETLGHLDRYQFMHTGIFRGGNEKRYEIVDINGIKVAILSYSYTFTLFNGKTRYFTLRGVSAMLNPFSQKLAAQDIAAAKEAGAEFIIVYMHWGREYTTELVDRQKDSARFLAESGADFIVGSHSHVLQEHKILETSDGRKVPVLYSVGNFISQQHKKKTRKTVIISLDIKEKDGKVHIDHYGYIPASSVTEWNGCLHPTVPIVRPYCTEKVPPKGLSDIKSIGKILGPEIPMIGEIPKR